MPQCPVFVYAPCHTPQVGSFCGSFPGLLTEATSLHVVGTLGDDLVDYAAPSFEKKRGELAKIGVDLELVLQSITESGGMVSCLVSAGVCCNSMKDALSLPGFKNLFMYSGPEYMTPSESDHTKIWERGDVEKWAIDDHPIPDFGNKDSVCFSAVPQGKIASYVFLKEDPDSFFLVKGIGGGLGDPAAIARAENAG